MRAILLILAFCAAPARADIIDGGNLIIGGQGIIGGTMTVQGSAFSVGGATFSVAGGSVTLGGRLNAAATGIRWADGTTSTTAASGGGGGSCAYNSTYTLLATDFATTATSTGTAITGATLTINLAQTSRLWIRGFGSLRNDSGGGQTYVSAVVDGQPLSEMGSGAAFCHMRAVGGLEVARYGCPIDWTTASTFSSGSHTIAFRMWVSGSTGTMDCDEARCEFEIQEVCQ